jgi:hypothetical protein
VFSCSFGRLCFRNQPQINACLRTQGNAHLIAETVLAASMLHQADFNARGDDGYTAIIKAAEHNKLAALVRGWDQMLCIGTCRLPSPFQRVASSVRGCLNSHQGSKLLDHHGFTQKPCMQRSHRDRLSSMHATFQS